MADAQKLIRRRLPIVFGRGKYGADGPGRITVDIPASWSGTRGLALQGPDDCDSRRYTLLLACPRQSGGGYSTEGYVWAIRAAVRS